MTRCSHARRWADGGSRLAPDLSLTRSRWCNHHSHFANRADMVRRANPEGPGMNAADRLQGTRRTLGASVPRRDAVIVSFALFAAAAGCNGGRPDFGSGP